MAMPITARANPPLRARCGRGAGAVWLTPEAYRGVGRGCLEHDPRVQDAGGVEQRLDAALQLERVVAELVGEPAALEHADAVLAGERAAEGHGGAEHLVGRLPRCAAAPRRP